jgi:hypothetical protein
LRNASRCRASWSRDALLRKPITGTGRLQPLSSCYVSIPAADPFTTHCPRPNPHSVPRTVRCQLPAISCLQRSRRRRCTAASTALGDAVAAPR